ncbi:MAG TPA: RNA polymerase subunit sigma-70, partial [Vineibacter sp.]|nr:RNA polymerase subunit sigma-70 [Vineibacter sp.]
QAGAAQDAHGPAAVATALLGRAGAQPVLVDGAVGLFVAPGGRLRVVLRLAFRNGRIAGIEAIADPERLRQINLAVLRD